MQPQIDRILPRPLSFRVSTDGLTLRQRGAVDWSFAIGSCLQRGMAFHARCGTCTVLMGPGHAEPGTDGFCGTHSEIDAPEPPEVSDEPIDVLAWISGNSTHTTHTTHI